MVETIEERTAPAVRTIGRPRAVLQPLDRVAKAGQSRVDVPIGELNRVLMDGDNPDIQMLSLDFLRLEILQHALEELGAEAELAQSRSAMLMFAVQVIRKVTQILRACTDGQAAAQQQQPPARQSRPPHHSLRRG